jgi:hypothetical protein
MGNFDGACASVDRPGQEVSGRSERMAALFFTLHIKQLFNVKAMREPRGVLSLDLFDVEAAEKIEAELDRFIEKRARAGEDQRRVEAEWAISERRHRERRRERNRELWRYWHLDQAERLERTAAELATDHRAKTAALAEDRAEW